MTYTPAQARALSLMSLGPLMTEAERDEIRAFIAAHPDTSETQAVSDAFSNLSVAANHLIGLLDTRDLSKANPDLFNASTISRLEADIAEATQKLSDLAPIEGDEEGNAPYLSETPPVSTIAETVCQERTAEAAKIITQTFSDIGDYMERYWETAMEANGTGEKHHETEAMYVYNGFAKVFNALIDLRKALHIDHKTGTPSPCLSETSAVPAGWKLVPVMPTEEQIDSATLCDAIGLATISYPVGVHFSPSGIAIDVYRAMLAAAPSLSKSPDQQPQEDLTAQIENLHPDEQFKIATRIAANIGYELTPEPDHPDSPHAHKVMFPSFNVSPEASSIVSPHSKGVFPKPDDATLIAKLQAELAEAREIMGAIFKDAFVTCVSDNPNFYVSLGFSTLGAAHTCHDATIRAAQFMKGAE